MTRAGALVATGVLAVTLAGFPAAQADPGLPGAGTGDVSAGPTGDISHLSGVGLSGQDGYDQLVLEFADRVPGYTVGYRPLPAHQDGSGFEIPLPGAGALLEVSLRPATATGWAGGPQTYFGPSALAAGTASVSEAKAAGDFEANLTWAVGVRSVQPFRVAVLDGPPRLIVDIAHPN